MGLAGGIFWIVIGAVYIIYRLYRENPGVTLACMIACAAILAFFLIVNALINSLTGWWLVLFVALLCVCVVLAAVYSVKLKSDQKDMQNKIRYEFEEAKRQVNMELEEHPELLDEWVSRQPVRVLSPLSKNPGSGLYWKKHTNSPWYRDMLEKYKTDKRHELILAKRRNEEV